MILLTAVSSSARSQDLDSAAGSLRKIPANQHCVARLEPVPGSPDSRISSIDCYPSFADAIHAATEGAVSLSPDENIKTQLKTLRNELKSTVNASTAGSGPVILAVDYVDDIYRGASLTYLGNATCSSTVSHQFGILVGGWDNQISSTQGFGGCNRNILYEHTNYGGASITCTPNCIGLGVMNDAASSRRMLSTCGEASCVNPDGNYISHFTGTNCNGTEYYYLPYDSFGYQCRPESSAGVQCGTAHNSITAYSYRYAGQCYSNAWPSGNPLNDLVRVYR